MICPECGSKLIAQSGCSYCPVCGFSACGRHFLKEKPHRRWNRRRSETSVLP